MEQTNDKAPIIITTIKDSITRIADRQGNRVEIKLDNKGDALTANVYFKNSTIPACPLTKAQIQDLKSNLRMPPELTWNNPVSGNLDEFFAVYNGPAYVLPQACNKNR